MPKIVKSKYFSAQAGMDDSLSDFQEKKKYNSGPKKTRNIKKPKQIRGQKDIRKLIKKQENDVLSYSKDFDKVCKQAGLDVDSEDLQLAIALSKSLTEVKKEENTNTETEHLTSQQRTLKIKTTLQEYGFKVPKAKITDTNRRKRYRKQYKLLVISEAERQQLISDKYSEVLARNVFNTPEKVFEYDYKDKQLYYKTTNITYEQIKHDDVFYVKDLFEKQVHKTCLLRNWSEIPGRPVSPTVQSKDINFDEITCDQYELNSILSGSIFAAQQIIKNKEPKPARDCIFGEVHKSKVCAPKALDVEFVHLDNCLNSKLTKDTLNIASNTMSVSQVRCISPDLFDDDASTVIECTDNEVQPIKGDNIYTFCMDLTECVNTEHYNNIMHTTTKFHDQIEINITNRKSNDFMEMTDCVSTGLKQTKIENVDLTQGSSNSDKQINIIHSQNDNVEVMDLTEAPCNEPPVHIGYKGKDNSLDDTVIVLNDDLNINLQQERLNLTTKAADKSITLYPIDDHLSDSNCKHNEHSLLSDDENTENLYEDPADKIDLTQSSNSSKGDIGVNESNANYCTSLGKRDNVSIDYDEIICDDVLKESEIQVSIKSLENHKNHSSSSEKESNSASNNNASNPSRSSEVFEISDKELNYSLHQSKQENYDFRNVSAFNNFPNFGSNSTDLHPDGTHFFGTKNRSLSESNLHKKSTVNPLTKVSQSQEHCDSETCTPIRVVQKNIKNVLQTPKNGEYIIKTNEVTPMLDYESMSSPERHKELEKYGLKPFKRKRGECLILIMARHQRLPIHRSREMERYEQIGFYKISAPLILCNPIG